jgi:transcriptional regulator with XRE-family HTH domain
MNGLKDGTTKDSVRAKEIGERIQLARRESGGMTQRELADLLGVTERSVAAYEAGDVIPYRFIRKLEEVLSRPATWLLYGEEGENGATTASSAKQDEIIQKLDQIITLLKRRK